MTTYPDCTCGANNWSGSGFEMGPGYQFYNRQCESCGNYLQYIGREGWWVTLIMPAVLGGVACDYANTVMAIQARAYKAEWEAAVEADETVRFNAMVVEWGLDPTKGVNYHSLDTEYTHTFANGKTYEAWDYEYQDDEGSRIDIDAHAFHEALKAMWEANPRRPSIVRAPDPINLPEGITAYVRRGDSLDLVVPDAMFMTEVPPDPKRVRHDAYFAAVFQTVRENTGCPRFSATEKPNGYYSDKTNSQPWFTFDVNGTEIVVGPRKRVVSIEATFPSARTVNALRDVAKADAVTYDVEGPWDAEGKAAIEAVIEVRDTGWSDKANAAYDDVKARYTGDPDDVIHVCVHAWSQEKTVEYLSLIVQAALR